MLRCLRLSRCVLTGLRMELFYVYQFKPNRLTGLRMENIPVNFLHNKRQMSNLIVDLSASIFCHMRKRSTRISCVYKVLEHSGSVTISYVLRRNILSPLTPAKPQYRWKCGAFSSSEAQKQLSYGDGPPGLHFQDQVKKWRGFFANLNSFRKLNFFKFLIFLKY